MTERIDALEKRVTELEQRSRIQYEQISMLQNSLKSLVDIMTERLRLEKEQASRAGYG